MTWNRNPSDGSMPGNMAMNKSSALDSYKDMCHSRTEGIPSLMILQHSVGLGVGKECCNSQNPKKPLTLLFAFVCNLTESFHHKDIFFHSYFSPSFSAPQGLRFLPHRNKFVCYGSAFGVCSVALHALSAHAQLRANCGTSIMSISRSCDAFKASKKYNLMLKYIIISLEEAL
jgi:hypothetical protein